MRILGYEITFFVRRISDPLSGLRTRDVDRLAVKDPYYGRERFSDKIARIKAVRTLRPGTSLEAAKLWVEAHYAE